MKHTPGPWEMYGQDFFGRSEKGEHEYVCTWSGRKSNARLIAAAPELLDALKDALQELETMSYARYLTLENKMRDAIKKAEGGNE